MKRLAIVQLGVTHEHASVKMETVRRLSDVFDVIGVVDDRAPECSGAAGGKHSLVYDGLPRMTEEQLFDSDNVEAVIVEKTNHDQPAAALRCAERGFHIHMDKPGGQAMEPFQNIVELCQEKERVFYMGYMYRTNPGLALCRQVLDKGWMGEVFEVDMTMNRFDTDCFRSYIRTFCGGAMYNFGSHLVDIAVTLLGRPERVTPFLVSGTESGVYGRNAFF